MSDSFPFHFDPAPPPTTSSSSATSSRGANLAQTRTLTLPNVRGRIPSLQASRLRTMVLEAHRDPAKFVPTVGSYDGLTSRLCEEAGFPAIFLGGYAMASSLGLPDAGYTAYQDIVHKIHETAMQVSVPIIVDGDTGFGSPMNTKRTVEGFARAGAAGIMIEDQTFPKRCGHTTGKAVVPREQALARVRAAVDARDQGLDIWILARTDALIESWDEALARARAFVDMGADAIFVEAVPERDGMTMRRVREEIDAPCWGNMLEGGQTPLKSAKELSEYGLAGTFYPVSLVAAHIKSVREALKGIRDSLMTGPPPVILPFEDVCEGVGFGRYRTDELRYADESYVGGR